MENGKLVSYSYLFNGDVEFETEDEKLIDKQRFIINDPENELILNHGYFGACLIKEKVEVQKIVFNIVGLYDTVASFGINHRGLKIEEKNIFGIKTPEVKIIGTDAEQLGLDAIKKARFILQISSADEFRENFSLTNIKSAGINGLEFTFPGVHSDIGGSYVDGDEEERTFYRGSESECKKMKKILVDEGWFNEKNELTIKLFTQTTTGSKIYHLVGIRKLSNEYDKVSLQTMYSYTMQGKFPVKYTDDVIASKDFFKNEEIELVYDYLCFYMTKCVNIINRYKNDFRTGKSVSVKNYHEEIEALSYLDNMPIEVLKNLRNKYLHWSVSDNFGMEQNPESKGIKTFDQRKRHIIPG